DVHHLKTDWLEANIGLIRPGLTKQQKVEAAWLNGTQTGGAAVLGAPSVTALVNDTTDGFYTSGHSLGGQLAENAALCCDENLYAHLKAAYSWDGPSETKEYYQRFGNRTQALRDAGVMHEYKWSFVGSIFETESPFVQTYIKTNDVITRDGKESKGALARVEKHDTCNVYLQNESV
ncbi:MAG: Mbeg1-like protein, partial [Ruthenibacterium sp.]